MRRRQSGSMRCLSHSAEIILEAFDDRARISRLVFRCANRRFLVGHVIAAGGIGSGRAMAAVLAAGADGVRVGTRFLAVEEAEAHPDYLQALITAEAQDTVYTEVFSADWPNAPHRVLRASLDAALTFEGEFVGTNADTWNGESYDVRRFGSPCLHKSASGTIAAICQYAGEGVGSVKRMQTASEIIHELVSEAEVLLKKWS